MGKKSLVRIILLSAVLIALFGALLIFTQSNAAIVMPITVTLTASPTTIMAGMSSTLSWNSTNTTSCTGSWSANTLLSSGSATVNPTATTTYSITCTGSTGPASASATVTVTQMPITVTLTASPTTIMAGMSSTLSWNSTSASYCTNDWNSSQAISGSAQVSPTTTRTYNITCFGTSGGSMLASATVTVTTMPPIVTLNANGTPNSIIIMSGMPVSLTWTSTNVTSCTGSWTSPANGSVALQNTTGTQVTPTAPSTTYTINCTGAGGPASSSVIVTVTTINQQAKLILEKQVDNTNGGTATGYDWMLFASGITPISGPGPSVSGMVNSGTYTLSETAINLNNTANYTQGSWSCKDTATNNPRSLINGNQIPLLSGDSVICTITNTSSPQGTLEIVKNATGGPGGEYFSFNINGLGVSNPYPGIITGSADSAGVSSGSTGGILLNILSMGSWYTITENVPPGWINTGASCTINGSNGFFVYPDPNGVVAINVYISPGDTVVCANFNAISNPKGKLKIIKTVHDKSYQGNEEFTFNIKDDVTPVESGIKLLPNSTSESYEKELDEGFKYLVEEVNLPQNWKLFTASCQYPDASNNNEPIYTGMVDSLGRMINITVFQGKTTTCTFENIKFIGKDPELKIFKETIAGYGSFPYKITNVGLLNSLPVATPTVATTVKKPIGEYTQSFKPGIYDVIEKEITNNNNNNEWYLVSATCKDQNNVVVATDSEGDGIHNMVLDKSGQIVTCTFVNAKKGQLIIQKFAEEGKGTFTFNYYSAGTDSKKGTKVKVSASTKKSKTMYYGNSLSNKIFLIPGKYEIEEMIFSEDWDFKGAACGNPSPTQIQLTNNANLTNFYNTANNNTEPLPREFNIESGKFTYCAFINKKNNK